MFCAKCGTELNGEFCSKCGQNCNQSVGQGQSKVQENVEGKSWSTAGILGLLLGFFGVHSFYLGRTKKGIMQAVIAVLAIIVAAAFGPMFFNLAQNHRMEYGGGFHNARSLALLDAELAMYILGGIILFGVMIWSLVDSIRLFTGSVTIDAKGNPLVPIRNNR